MFFLFCFCFAEIIYISSDTESDKYPWMDSTSESDNNTDSWKNYFPKTCSNSSTKRMDAMKIETPEQDAKEAFNNRVQVLGLPNLHKCQEIRMKPFVPKIPNDLSKGKGKKTMG